MADQPSPSAHPRSPRKDKAPLRSRAASPKGASRSSTSARPSGGRKRSPEVVAPSYQTVDQLASPSKFGFDQEGFHIPTGNSELLLSRRQLLYGAAAIGGIAAVGGVATVIANNQAAASDINTLDVAVDDVFDLESCTELASEDALSLVASCELPYGSLVWASSDAIAACLIPTEEASPLCQIALLNLGSGTYSVIVESAIGAADGYEIYDVRACDAGILWTEANILQGRWIVWAAPYNGSSLGEAVRVEEGDGAWEMPSLAAVGAYGYWQIQPKEDGEASEESSVLKRARFTRLRETETLYEADGMASPVYPASEGVVITPRHYQAPSYFQLVYLDGTSGETADAITLPSRMRPLEAGYGANGFMFSFSNIYDYGGGIANLGTYTPAEEPKPYDYDGLTWFHFPRVPSMAPCWLDDRFVVKSTMAVCVIDLANRSYSAIPLENNTEDYGDYLASFGVRKSIVTCMNIDESKSSGTAPTDDAKRFCLARVWQPIEPLPSSEAPTDSSEEDAAWE